jgi:FkbM family methyltransferase
MQSSAVTTTVIDAGGRYGLHPTWKPFAGELHYVLFEPDISEARRLEEKYAKRQGEVFVESLALAGHSGHLTINFFKNRAMSSSAVRKPTSALFTGERLAEVEVVETVDIQAVTIDGYCRERDLKADFFKLDTEGSEFDILKGAEAELASHVLGVRSEVSFERIFESRPLFGTLHEFLLDRNFYLLNLDYDGRGENQNEFVRVPGKYGILQTADGVWLLRKSELFARSGSNDECAARVLKYAAFCLNNFASDVALDVLLEARRAYRMDFSALSPTKLYRHVDAAIHRLFYDLKWQPGQSLRKNEGIYAEVFAKDMKTMHDYMQSIELNPD